MSLTDSSAVVLGFYLLPRKVTIGKIMAMTRIIIKKSSAMSNNAVHN